jgi:hypothetical protein
MPGKHALKAYHCSSEAQNSRSEESDSEDRNKALKDSEAHDLKMLHYKL